jgi:integral membrane protein
VSPPGVPAPGVRGALARYRVMAIAVGIGLLVLVLAGVPLQLWAGYPEVVHVVGPIHGFLYIVYLVAAADLARRAGWPFSRLAEMILAGLVPFLAFIVERRVTRLAHGHPASARA